MADEISKTSESPESKSTVPVRRDDIEKLGAQIRPFQKEMRPSWRFVSRSIVGISRLLVGFEIIHLDRVPAEGAFLAVATHTSHLDPGIVGSALGRETYYLARSGILRVPLVGHWCRHFNTLAIRRGESDRQALKMCRKVLEAGWPLVFFPEGTRSEDGKLGPIQGGFAMILDGLDVPYLPIVIQDTYKVMPKGRWFPWFAKVRMIIGEPAKLPERIPGEPARERLARCTAELEKRWRELGAK